MYTSFKNSVVIYDLLHNFLNIEKDLKVSSQSDSNNSSSIKVEVVES